MHNSGLIWAIFLSCHICQLLFMHWMKPVTHPKSQVSVWFHCFTGAAGCSCDSSTASQPRQGSREHPTCHQSWPKASESVTTARNKIIALLRVTLEWNLSESTTVLSEARWLGMGREIPPGLCERSAGFSWQLSFQGKSGTASWYEIFSLCRTTLPSSLTFLRGPTIFLIFPLFSNT